MMTNYFSDIHQHSTTNIKRIFQFQIISIISTNLLANNSDSNYQLTRVAHGHSDTIIRNFNVNVIYVLFQIHRFMLNYFYSHLCLNVIYQINMPMFNRKCLDKLDTKCKPQDVQNKSTTYTTIIRY